MKRYVLTAALALLLAASAAHAAIIWPIRPSSSGRYFVDSSGSPVLLIGDSAQSVIGSINETDEEAYLADRESKGINALWAHLYGDYAPNVNGAPFNGSDVSAPRAAYFEHVDRFLNMAKKHGILVFLGVSGLNSHVDAAFVNNGPTKLYNYGTFLGNRWKSQGNIVWTIGNDWSGYINATQNNNMLQLARGIKGTDTSHQPFTIEIYPTPKLSTDAFYTGWDRYVNINSVYTYAPVYKTTRRGYLSSPTIPNILFETIYETRHDDFSKRHGYEGTPRILRSTEHWSILSGANGGYMYGNEATWGFTHADLALLNSASQKRLLLLKELYGSRRWYNLVPDFSHAIGTAGYGAFQPGTEWKMNMPAVTATTVAATQDGRLMIAYMERRRNLTVNMSRLAFGVRAKWFNPESGSITPAGGPFIGPHLFVPPTRAGDNDWVLIIE